MERASSGRLERIKRKPETSVVVGRAAGEQRLDAGAQLLLERHNHGRGLLLFDTLVALIFLCKDHILRYS
jgi:hypothetical protein